MRELVGVIVFAGRGPRSWGGGWPDLGIPGSLAEHEKAIWLV